MSSWKILIGIVIYKIKWEEIVVNNSKWGYISIKQTKKYPFLSAAKFHRQQPLANSICA